MKMFKTFGSAALRSRAAVFVAAKSPKTAPYTLYVDPTGSDAAAGTKSAPLQTLNGARLKVASLTASQKAGGVVVTFAPGIYAVSSQTAFTSSDDGTLARPTIYRSETPHGAVFECGYQCTGWSLITDADPIYELLSAPAQAAVYSCDVSGATLGTMMRGATRKTDAVSGTWANTPPPALFDSGARQTLARHPNSGWLTFGATVGAPGLAFECDGHPDGYASVSDVWVRFWAKNNYTMDFEEVDTYVPATNVLTLKNNPQSGMTSGKRYCYENAVEDLDSAGEYWIDRATDILYYWPSDPTTLESAVYLSQAPSTSNVVYLNGVSNVEFHGFQFRHGLCDGFRVNASGYRMRWYGCSFTGMERNGIVWQGRGGMECRIDSCDFIDMGQAGPYVWGGNSLAATSTLGTLVRGENVVTNCRILRCGYGYGAPALSVFGVGQTITHNTIEDSAGNSCAFGGVGHAFEWNDVQNPSRWFADTGAFYTGFSYTNAGHVFRYNRIVHTSNGITDGAGVGGVYLDFYTPGTVIDSNLMIGLSQAVQQNGTRDVSTTNNVFYDCGYGVRLLQRGVAGCGGAGGSQEAAWLATYKPQLDAISPAASPWSQFAYLDKIYTDGPMEPRRNIFTTNVFYADASLDYYLAEDATEPAEAYTDGCWWYKGTNYYGETPGFVNFPASLATTPGGNADLAGFVAWDVSLVGCSR